MPEHEAFQFLQSMPYNYHNSDLWLCQEHYGENPLTMITLEAEFKKDFLKVEEEDEDENGAEIE